MIKPYVSVLMTVYNGEQYLHAAIDSILSQSFKDFEFLIVDDGSTDNSTQIVKEYCDSRINLICAQHNGLVASLNLGLSQARANYIARMDADDIARHDRIAVQTAYLDSMPNTGLVCSNIRVIDTSGQIVGTQHDTWLDKKHLLDGLLYKRPMKPIIHPSVMMRCEVVKRIGGYRNFEAAEDRDFWLRAVDQFGFDRIQEYLLDYRMHPEGISRKKSVQQEVSSAMSVVNWIVRNETGEDLFLDHPALFARTEEVLRKQIEATISPGASAFRDARNAIRSGNMFEGLFQTLTNYIQFGRLALPDGARAALEKLIKRTVSEACNNLSLENV